MMYISPRTSNSLHPIARQPVSPSRSGSQGFIRAGSRVAAELVDSLLVCIPGAHETCSPANESVELPTSPAEGVQEFVRRVDEYSVCFWRRDDLDPRNTR